MYSFDRWRCCWSWCLPWSLLLLPLVLLLLCLCCFTVLLCSLLRVLPLGTS